MIPTVPDAPRDNPQQAAGPPPTNASPPPAAVPPGYTPPVPGYVPAPHRGAGRAVVPVVIGVAVVVVLLCAGSIAAVGALAGWWATHQVNATRTSAVSFAVPDHPQLIVHDTAGTVTVVAGTARQITVDITKRATDSSSQSAQHALDAITVTTHTTDQGLVIDATTSADHPLTRQSVDLRIAVPATTDMELDLKAGTAHLAGFTGRLTATMAAGNLDLRDVVLDGASRVQLNAGNADLRTALQPDATLDMQVHTGNARLALPQESPTLLTARTTVGNVTINGWPATIRHTGAGASTEVYCKLAPHNHVNVTVDTGNIAVSAY